MLANRTPNKFANRVGLDVGSHTINGVEVVEHGSEIVIRSVESTAITGDRSTREPASSASTVRAIKNLWSSAQFRSTSVVLAMPSRFVYTKWLHIEAADIDELEQTALSTAARGAPFPAADAITDFRILSARTTGSRTRYSVMLVAASSSALDAMLDMAQSAGLETIAVDIAVAAAVRSFATQKKAAGPLWSDQPLAHCIVGAHDTTIAVVRGDTLEFSRTVPVGGDDFTQCVAEHTGAGWAEAESIKVSPGARLEANGIMTAPVGGGEASIPCEPVIGRLAREIHRSLRFFSSQFPEASYLGMIGATTLSGGGALLRGLDSCLRDQGLDVAGTINPFVGYSVAVEEGGVQHAGDAAAAYTTAVGLAIGNYWSNVTEAQVNLAA